MRKIISQLTRPVSAQTVIATATGGFESRISSNAISGELYAIRRDEPDSGRLRWDSD